MRVSLHACLKNLFAALHERGGATLLADVHARLARPLLALSLRVAPPDPIDSALFDAQPVPLWPKYVGLWVDLLGGDGLAQPGAPSLADDAEGPRGKKKAPRDLVGEASSRLRRSRSRSIEMERGETERSSANRSSLDHSPMDVDAPSSDEASARAFVGASLAAYDAFVGEVLQLCQTLNLEVVPLRRGPGGGAAEEAGGFGGSRRGRGRDDARSGSGARRGVAAADPGDARTFLSLVDLTCARSRHAERVRHPVARAARRAPRGVRERAPTDVRILQDRARRARGRGGRRGVRRGASRRRGREGDGDGVSRATSGRRRRRAVVRGARADVRAPPHARRARGALDHERARGASARRPSSRASPRAVGRGGAGRPRGAATRAAAESTTGERRTRRFLRSSRRCARTSTARLRKTGAAAARPDAASGVDPVAAGATGAGYREAKRAAPRARGGSWRRRAEGLDARDGGLDARVARLIGRWGGAAHALVGGARGGGGRAGVANAGKTTTAVAASDGGSCLNDASVWDPTAASAWRCRSGAGRGPVPRN